MSIKFFIISMTTLLLLGLGFVLGLYFFIYQDQSNKSPEVAGPVTSEPVSLTFTLSAPDDNLLVFDPDILIAGKTSPHAFVILSTNQDDLSLETTSAGDFSTSIKLQPGLNFFKVTVFDEAGNSKEDNRTVYYSTEKI